MKNTRWTILAALVLAATSVAHAQDPAPLTPGAAPTNATAATDTGVVSNVQTTDTTTTTSSSGIGADGVAMEMNPGMQTTELANTGGEPVLMSLIGLSMALGAFAIRKRISA